MSQSLARRAASFLLKFVVSGGLLYYLCTKIDLPRMRAQFQHTSAAWLIAGAVFFAAMVCVSGWRWRALLKTQEVDAPLGALTVSFLVATFFNNFLPTNIGGDVMRLRDGARYTGSKTLSTIVILADRALGLLALFAVALGASSLVGQHGIRIPGLRYLWLTMGVTVVASANALLAPRLVPFVLAPLRRLHPEWVGERLQIIADSLERLRRRPGTLAGAFLASIVIQLSLVLFYATVARALHIPLTLRDCAIIVPITLAVQMLPLSINGFGIREATLAILFSSIGLSIEAAMAFSLVGTGALLVCSLAGGLAYLIRS